MNFKQTFVVEQQGRQGGSMFVWGLHYKEIAMKEVGPCVEEFGMLEKDVHC